MRSLAWRALLACILGWLVCPAARATEYDYVRATDLSRMACAAPAGWREVAFDDRAWAPRDSRAPDGGVASCPGTLYVRQAFLVGPELARLATATLRIRYSHGFAAFLNGVEIARRRLDAKSDGAALATDWHGLEAERVFVPVRAGLLKASGNVLAIEVHPRTAGREPFVEAELVGADGVRIVRGPYLQRLAENEVTIVFDTDLPSLGEVHWGPGETYGETVTDAPPQRHHALRLTGLKSGSVYHYRVAVRPLPMAVAQAEGLPLSNAIDSGDAAFHTPPAAGKPLRFIVYGDVRSGHEVHALLDQKIAEEDPDLALVTGDLVDRGSDEGDWERFFEIAAGMLRQVAIFPVAGNHEYARLGHGLPIFQSLFRWPVRAGEEDAAYYSFDAAGVHFVALDSNQYRSPRQLAWLEADLAQAEKAGARALFVYAHEPPYSTGMHGDNQIMIHDYVPILERHHVSMFFGGHDHDYERGRVGKLDYVISGGGGAELRSARCGVPGKRACPPHVLAFSNEHHYVLVEVTQTSFRVCPKRPDGTPLEACAEIPFRR